MYHVEIYVRVRRACMVEGMSVREASRVFGLHRDTVRKMLAYSAPPGYRRQDPPRRPRLEPFTGVIDAILEADRQVPRKQRHTAKRIFERLRDEHGFDGQYTIVKDYVRERRRRTQEIFVPLSHAPGHAQCDFGEARVIIGGVERKAHYWVLDLPHSDGCFVKAYPAETTEGGEWRLHSANGPETIPSPIAQTFDAAIAIRDIIKAQLNRKVFIFPVLCFPDMAPDPIIEARAAEGHVTVLWGGDDLIGRLKELAKTQTIHRPPTAERIAQEVELIQPGMGHPAGAPAPASAPATADAVVELPGGRLVVHVHVHLSRDPLTLG